MLLATAERRLGGEYEKRAAALVADTDENFALRTEAGRAGRLAAGAATRWRRLGPGKNLLAPRILLDRRIDARLRQGPRGGDPAAQGLAARRRRGRARPVARRRPCRPGQGRAGGGARPARLARRRGRHRRARRRRRARWRRSTRSKGAPSPGSASGSARSISSCPLCSSPRRCAGAPPCAPRRRARPMPTCRRTCERRAARPRRTGPLLGAARLPRRRAADDPRRHGRADRGPRPRGARRRGEADAVDPALVTSLGLLPETVAKLMRDIGFRPERGGAGLGLARPRAAPPAAHAGDARLQPFRRAGGV